MNLCNSIGLELPFGFTTSCCPLIVPLRVKSLKQTLHADLKLVPRAKTSWASDILRAFEGLRGCMMVPVISVACRQFKMKNTLFSCALARKCVRLGFNLQTCFTVYLWLTELLSIRLEFLFLPSLF